MSLKTKEISGKFQGNYVWIESERKPDKLRVSILSSMYFPTVVEFKCRILVSFEGYKYYKYQADLFLYTYEVKRYLDACFKGGTTQ